jgi:tight adherence protein C
MDWNLIITILSAAIAGMSFIIIAMPLIQREDKRARHQDIIHRRRKDLYDNAKELMKGQSAGRKDDKKQSSALTSSQSVALTMRVEKAIGAFGKDLKKKLAKAGYRNPKAPLIYVLMRIILPMIFIMLALMVMSKADEPIASGIKLLTFMGCGAAGYWLPPLLIKNAADKRQQEINQSFPDAMDMLLVCVQGGISIEQAINRVAVEVVDLSSVLAEEIGLLGAELGMLSDRREAFKSFADRVGSGSANSFATSMIQAEKYGTNISTALRVMADELRAVRMSEAERKAAALPPKLTVPMILCFLPALFIVILGPAGIQASGM